jgi:hypothetical protein
LAFPRKTEAKAIMSKKYQDDDDDGDGRTEVRENRCYQRKKMNIVKEKKSLRLKV